MKTTTSTRTLRRTAAGLAAGAVGLLGVLPIGVAQAAPAPQRMQTPGPTPVPHLAIEGSPGCTRAGTTTSCTLYARSGSVMVDGDLPPDPLPVWVFDDVNSGDVELLNPVIEMVEGDTLAITLTNVNVPANVSLAMPVVPGVPDASGVGAGATTNYSFSGLAAGTYLYQAGPTPTGARQIAMGMAGAVIVRPAEFTSDGTPPTVGLTTVDDTLGGFNVNVVVADEAGGSGVALAEWFETDPVGAVNPLATAGGQIAGQAAGADITVRAVDVAGNETVVDLIVGGAVTDHRRL